MSKPTTDYTLRPCQRLTMLALRGEHAQGCPEDPERMETYTEAGRRGPVTIHRCQDCGGHATTGGPR